MSRRFLITGATKGIGLALSRQLKSQGHQIVGIARVPKADFPGEFHPLDLSAPGSDAAISAIISERGIDGVVNNVGIVKGEPLGSISPSTLDEVFRVNLHPALIATQAALPRMKDRGWGRVVNISSLSILGTPERTSYAAAKAALASFTRTWALELATTGITVNAIAPGPTETEMFRSNNPAGSISEQRALANVPMKRFGSPHEIAAAIAFLLSDEASFITGQTIHVDGGASIGKAAF
jgi:3-oxoacyl-[acyl-carrier protein] reductase